MRLAASKVSGKLQITLPKKVVDRLGVKPGDYVSFLEERGSITIRRARLAEG